MNRLYTRRDVLGIGAGVGLALAFGGMLEACSSAATTAGALTGTGAETTLQRIKRTGTVNIGFSNEQPWYYLDSSGKLIGASPDVSRYIMNQLGVTNIGGVLVDFSGLLPGLQAGRFDMTCSMNVLPARCLIARPGDPETQTGDAFIVKKGNPKNLHSYADVAKSTDAKLGVYQASSQLQEAQTLGIPSDRIVTFPDLATAIAGIETGRADAIADAYVAEVQGLKTTNDPALELAQPFTQPTDAKGNAILNYGASYFRLGDPDLRDAYNGVLKTIKGNGELLKILQPYGFTQDQVPPVDLTSDQLCAAGS
jgi:polar amino acid transport system substrate-binding protein